MRKLLAISLIGIAGLMTTGCTSLPVLVDLLTPATAGSVLSSINDLIALVQGLIV